MASKDGALLPGRHTSLTAQHRSRNLTLLQWAGTEAARASSSWEMRDNAPRNGSVAVALGSAAFSVAICTHAGCVNATTRGCVTIESSSAAAHDAHGPSDQRTIIKHREHASSLSRDRSVIRVRASEEDSTAGQDRSRYSRDGQPVCHVCALISCVATVQQ